MNAPAAAARPSTAPPSVVNDVLDRFREKGDSLYGGEGVTQLGHALQAATLAEQEGASGELIAAALLHDFGHLLHDLPEDTPDQGVDDVHENLAAEWLRGRFPAAVIEPIRLHVESKRYLCATEPGYWESLSEPSQVSLELQGGRMSPAECEAFRASPSCEDALRLRRWDDAAKVVGLATPSLEHFVPHLRHAAESLKNPLGASGHSPLPHPFVRCLA